MSPVLEKSTVMKKSLLSACLAFSMFALAACNTNPAIKLAKGFLDEPTLDNLMKIQELEEEMSEEDIQEYDEWVDEHRDDFEAAIANLGF